MSKEELQKKYYYVQVRNKYEVIKAHDLLSKIDMPIFTDETILRFLKKDNDIEDNFLMKDSGGWRIQSHFISTDHSIEELEEDINIYLRKKDRDNLTDIEKEKCEKLILKLNNNLQAFTCLASISYDNAKDLEEVINKFEKFNQTISKRWSKDFLSFRKNEDFKSKFESFLRNNKLNEILQ